MAKLVRLKPYDPKRGHVLRRFTAFGVRFDEARGWYRVSDEVAAYVATVHEQPGFDYTPLAFDVCTEEEALALEIREKREQDERAIASAPNVATAQDVSSVKPPTVSAGDLSTTDLSQPKPARGEARAQRRA